MVAESKSQQEEIANAITHGIGAGLSIAALVLLTIFSSIDGTAWHIVSFALFGSALVILYVMSTLYHALTPPKAKHLFRKFDHMSIFLLIASTYTPFCLILMKGLVGWIIFGSVWALALTGIVLKALCTGKHEIISTALYVVMGWIALFFIGELYENLSTTGFTFLLVGGACYTFGVYFFVRDSVAYNHSIWHLFVLGGSTFHFFSVLTLLSVPIH